MNKTRWADDEDGRLAKTILRMRWMSIVRYNMDVCGLEAVDVRADEDVGAWYRSPTWHPIWTRENRKNKCSHHLNIMNTNIGLLDMGDMYASTNKYRVYDTLGG